MRGGWRCCARSHSCLFKPSKLLGFLCMLCLPLTPWKVPAAEMLSRWLITFTVCLEIELRKWGWGLVKTWILTRQGGSYEEW